jgi:polar amino acid transport system substrate-binding protein
MFKLRVAGALLATVLLAACGGTGGGQPAGQSNCAVKTPTGLSSSGKLTWGSDISYPPQEFFQANQAVGFDVDIGGALAEKMCLKSVFVNQGFDGIIPALNAKKFDAIISAMTINDKRKEQVDFVPYFNAGEALVGKKGSSLKITDLSQLCGHTVAVEQGTAEADEIKDISSKCSSGSSIDVKTFPVDTEALEQLRKGSVDLHFTDSPVADYEVKKNNDLQISSDVLETAPEGIAVRKDASSLMTAIKDAFSAIEKDGTYDKILDKWGLKDGDIRKASS